MDRRQLQDLSRTRQSKSLLLLNYGAWAGAYYLGGYAAECALKACIARAARPYEFPDKQFAKNVWTHDLKDLVKHAGLEADREHRTRSEQDFVVSWGIVKDWSEQSRYEVKTETEARDFFRALTLRRCGILPWIRRHW